MDPEVKTTGQQAPAEKPVEEKKSGVVQTPSLEGLTADKLKELYVKSPELFKEIIPSNKPVVEEPKAKPPEQKPASAAPVWKFGEVEIKVPEGVPVPKERLESYFAHAKENGLSAEQVQRQIDFEVKQYQEWASKQPKPKSKEEIAKEEDAKNVAVLQQRWGKEYESKMDIARRAATKYASEALKKRLTTSDPDLVEHFYEIGKANLEDLTPESGALPRKGTEAVDEKKEADQYLRERYKNSPEMFNDADRSGT